MTIPTAHRLATGDATAAYEWPDPGARGLPLWRWRVRVGAVLPGDYGDAYSERGARVAATRRWQSRTGRTDRPAWEPCPLEEADPRAAAPWAEMHGDDALRAKLATIPAAPKRERPVKWRLK